MITVVTGPMWASKSSYLLGEYEGWRDQSDPLYKRCLVFKPWIDSRDGSFVKTHNGTQMRAVQVSGVSEIVDKIRSYDLIIVDEAQFLADIDDFANDLIALSSSGCHFVFAGLDLDFQGKPFPAMGSLLALADSVKKRTASCTYGGCLGGPARYTQRMQGGRAVTDGETIVIGSGDTYEPRCATHFALA